MSRANALEEEDRRVRRIKAVVDEACLRITSGDLGREEALRSAQSVRAQVEEIAPDAMDTYDLIYAARLRRLIEQFVGRDA